MKVATIKTWDKVEQTIERTAQDTIGDILQRTKRKLKKLGYTHYTRMGYHREL